MSSFRYDNVSTMPCDTMLCLVMHKTGGILVGSSCMMSREDVDCTQEHDGEDSSYIEEFHAE